MADLFVSDGWLGANNFFSESIRAGAAAVRAAAPRAPRDNSPAKHVILNKESDCWRGAKLKRVRAVLVTRYMKDGKSAPLPANIRPIDDVTICWEDRGGDDILNVIGRTLESGTRTVAKAATNPTELLNRVPGLNKLTQYVPAMPNPVDMATGLVTAVAQGDLKAIKREVLEVGHVVANVASMVPGVGNVIGGPLASAITLLETGSALKAALALLLGQVPGIPPQIRDVLSAAFNAIADIVEESAEVTDVLLAEFKRGVREQAARSGISGPIADLVESVLDGAIQLILQRKPLDRAALDLAERGLETARAHALPDEIREAEEELEDLKQVYDEIDAARTIARGVAEVVKLDPERKDPIVQRRIADLRTSLDTRKRNARDKAAAAKRRPPQLRAPKAASKNASQPTPKAAPPPAPPQLRAPQPRKGAPAPARPAVTPPRYGPYPATLRGSLGVGFMPGPAWRWFTVYANGRPIVHRGPMWLTASEAADEEASFVAATLGRAYIGTVARWDWNPSTRRWQRGS